jgi:hypothetical protein
LPTADGIDNGVVESSYGVHTNREPNAWVQIDLQSSLPIHEVRVYNRGDGYGHEILPVVLQLSDDGAVFSDVGRRDTLYTQDDPWIVKLENKRARYLRVLNPSPGGYISLSEITVF